MADVNLVSIIMNSRDQSNFVASNIKDSELSDLIGMGEDLPQLREIQKPVFARDRVPTRKR